MQNGLRHLAKAGSFALILLFAVILLPGPAVAAKDAAGEGAPAAATSGVSDYVLGVGDKVKITVFGEGDLSGDFEVTSTGKISMTLIGEIDAAGRTLSQLQGTITTKLLDGYMKDPHVSVEVGNYRPFFIVGEVMKPGSYGYVNGMTVINAIAMAGGYTYRASKSEITLRRGGNQGKEEKVEEGSSVHPGDVVSVPERFF